MDQILIFSLDSRLFQNSAYEPLADRDFFRWRQAGYIIGLYGQAGRIEAKANQLRLNLNLFFWLKEGHDSSQTLASFVEHLKQVARIDETGYQPEKVVVLSSEVTDYLAARALGLNFIAVCLSQAEADDFIRTGLPSSLIIIKDKRLAKISADLNPLLLRFFLS